MICCWVKTQVCAHAQALHPSPPTLGELAILRCFARRPLIRTFSGAYGSDFRARQLATWLSRWLPTEVFVAHFVTRYETVLLHVGPCNRA